MKKFTKLTLVTAAAFALLGCGKSMTGSYALTETLNGVSSTCTTTQLSMTLIQSGKNITGQAVGNSSSCFSESLSGTDQGNGQYTVNVTLVPSANYGYGNQSCSYSGTLYMSGTQLIGTLNGAAPAPAPSNQPQATSTYCSTSISFTGTLQQ